MRLEHEADPKVDGMLAAQQLWCWSGECNESLGQTELFEASRVIPNH